LRTTISALSFVLLIVLPTPRRHLLPSSSGSPSDPDPVAVAWGLRFHIDPELAGKIVRAAGRNGLDTGLAFRLVQQESRFRVNALGDAGEIGLTQIKPSTAGDLRPGVTIDQLYEPGLNLDLGFAYLAQLRTRYHGDMWRAATAYNHGMAIADTLHGRTDYAMELLGALPARGRRPAVSHEAD